MKKFLLALVIVGLVCSMSSCVTAAIGPYNATIFDKSSEPVSVTANKIGTAPKSASLSVENYLGLVNLGDASIKSLLDQSGITKVYYIDKQIDSYVGCYSKTTYTIYGE